MTAQEYKEQLVERVITQIVEDVDNGDTTAIHEMFAKVHETVLEAFLPEGTLEEFVNRG
jgi:hypothetical protein